MTVSTSGVSITQTVSLTRNAESSALTPPSREQTARGAGEPAARVPRRAEERGLGEVAASNIIPKRKSRVSRFTAGGGIGAVLEHLLRSDDPEHDHRRRAEQRAADPVELEAGMPEAGDEQVRDGEDSGDATEAGDTNRALGILSRHGGAGRSAGEGGGQVLRSALSLSLITGQPFHLRNVRARRDPTGLRPQHLACVRGAEALGQGSSEGARVGSAELTFEPGEVRPGDHLLDVGTAGSAPLLLQCLFYPLALAGGGTLTLRGGTHLPHSPAYPYLSWIGSRRCRRSAFARRCSWCRPASTGGRRRAARGD